MINVNHPKPYLNKKEVAELFSLDARTITNWMNEKTIPYKVLPNGHPRFIRKEVMRILNDANQKMYDPKQKHF
ncbi:MAG: hypothetical protein MK105_19580 [Crocinitomicaceae bacterium]|nr:hypothetical protein [Crocinitomicaceae bacterium]